MGDVTHYYYLGFIGGVIFMFTLLFGVIRCCKPEWLQTLRVHLRGRLQRHASVSATTGHVHESPMVLMRGFNHVQDLGGSLALPLQGISREVHV